MRIRMGIGGYERTRALCEGRVRPHGLDIECMSGRPADILRRMSVDTEFDVGEFSLADDLRERALPRRECVSVPVFTHRAFRHSMLWVGASSELTDLGQLRGKRVGIGGYATTALLYLRGLLQDEHGLAPSDITWVRAEPERIPLDVPDVTIEDADQDLETLLEAGAVDAIASFSMPKGALGRPTKFRRLIPNVREVEADYYRRTGIFPIMHVIVLRRSIDDADRTIAPRLMDAFEEAKRLAYEEIEQTGYASHSLTPWSRYEIEEMRMLFGGEAYPYGVEPSRKALEAAVRYARAQFGLTLPDDVAELFAPSVRDWKPKG